MHDPHIRSISRKPPADLHQTTRVARYDRLHSRTLDRFDLLIEDGYGDLGILHGESAAETATRLGVFEFDKLCAAHVANQCARLALHVQIAQTVTRVVP